MVKFENGILKNVTSEDYHADREYLSSSSIKESIKSLAHFNHYRNKKSERKSYFDFGNAFEIALLDYIYGTVDFMNQVVIFDESERPEKDKGITSTINQNWKKSILNGEKLVISKTGAESFETIVQMLQSCARDSVIQKLLKNTEYQNSYFWTDEKTGVNLKTRPDLVKVEKGVVIDVKTTRDASPKGFSQQAANLEYPIQAAIQMRGLIETGQHPKIEAYYWLAVEKEAPYNAQIYEFQREDWAFINDKLDYYLTIIAQAMKENKFVGYGQQADNELGILSLELPLYYRNI